MAKDYVAKPWRPTLTCPAEWAERAEHHARRHGEATADALRRYVYDGLKSDEREERGIPMAQPLRVYIGGVLDTVARDDEYRTARDLNRTPVVESEVEARERRNAYIDQIVGALIQRIEDATR